MYRNYKIGVTVPAYNEEQLIQQTLDDIPSFVDKIYVVDDCSSDNTSELVKRAMLTNNKIKLIEHKKNQGVGGAIVSGFKEALKDNMDIVAVMSGDNQMDGRYLSSLLDPIIEEKADFTKGNRLKKGYWNNMSKFRLIGNFILSFINKFVSGYWTISDPQNGYVAIRCSILKQVDLNSLQKGYVFENDLMVKANLVRAKMLNVQIPAIYGEEISGIKYKEFIMKTSFYFFVTFFWRIWNKYFKRAK